MYKTKKKKRREANLNKTQSHPMDAIHPLIKTSLCCHGQLQPLPLSQRVTEVAAVTVRTLAAGCNHPAELSLVARVPHHRAELPNAVCKLAVLSVRTRASLLPLVAQLSLHHPLIEHLHLALLHPHPQ